MNKLNKYIDHTILKAFATKDDVKTLCECAKENDFASVCINPYYVSYAKELLKGTDVKVCTVIGFPLGATKTETKVFEAKEALKDGCDEFDMVINVGALKYGDYDYVLNDIKAVVEAVKGHCLKVIIETYFLNDEEKVKAVELSCQAGATYVKTCTGFNEGVATVEDVKLMKANVTNGVKVKASSGIRCYEDAVKLIAVGAERLGTSAGVKIMEGSKNG